MTEIKDRLKKALDESGMTLTELANKSGIGKGSISKYLHGTVIPKQSAIGELARALHVSPAWLLGFNVTEDGRAVEAQLDLDALTDENRLRVLAYYQALIDSQEGKT